MALPSFQSVFVPGNNSTSFEDLNNRSCGNSMHGGKSERSSSEPDSDFEYDIFSDCSSNVPSPFYWASSPAGLSSVEEETFCPLPVTLSDLPLTPTASPSPSPSSTFSSSYSPAHSPAPPPLPTTCPYDLLTLLTCAASPSATQIVTLPAAFNTADEFRSFPAAGKKRNELAAAQSAFPTAAETGGSSQTSPGLQKRRRLVKVKPASHVCALCSKAFHSPSQLEEHCNYRHSDERKYQCEKCLKVFKTRSNLNQHTRTHMGATLPCPQCDRLFTVSGLRYHLLTHQAEKRFPCPHCHMSFVQNKLLQKHLQSRHSEARHFPCPHCALAFKRQDHLSRHVSDTHSLVDKLFECAKCGGRYQSANRLTQHEKLHREERKFKCLCCGRAFRKKLSLDSHVTRVHEKKHQLQGWEESSSLQVVPAFQ